eukprot:3762218-Heterocapsa_arctica.AAC.1
MNDYVEPHLPTADDVSEGGRAAQLRAACTCDACVKGTRRTRRQPVEAMSSTEATSRPTAATRAGVYEASDFRSSLPAGTERPEVSPGHTVQRCSRVPPTPQLTREHLSRESRWSERS